MNPEITHICTLLAPRLAETVRYYSKNLCIEEIRIRRDGMLSLTVGGQNLPTEVIPTANEFEKTVLSLSAHSLYTHLPTIAEGYLRLTGGYRVGVCTSAMPEGGASATIADITSLNIRIPYRPRGISEEVCKSLANRHFPGTLIFSAPNGGKTTLLSDIAYTLSAAPYWLRVTVVDTRGEIACEETGIHMLDILRGHTRAHGIALATRTLSPQYIICDEIGTAEEAEAMQSAMHAGVPILATTHARTTEELFEKQWVYDMCIHNIFRCVIEIVRTEETFCYHLHDTCEFGLFEK